MLNDSKKEYYLANTTETEGQLNDLELSWLKANGATSDVLMDAWAEYFDAQSVPAGPHSDRKFAWLGSLGYEGSLAEREGALYA